MNKKFVKRVSLTLALSLIVSNFYLNSNKVKADTAYPYTISTDTNNFQKPNIYNGQVIMADEYQDTPGWTAREGYNEAPGWKFYQTVMFPADHTSNDTKSINYMAAYDNSKTGAQAMANANYWVDENDLDDQDSHYYLNYKFKTMDTDHATYNYPDLIYYRTVPMYGNDKVRIGYQIDKSSFTPASGGAVMWQPFPDSSDYHESTKFVHDYHLATITANPTHTAPISDFYFNNGDTSETVSSGQTVKVVDGTASDAYDNTSSLFWSTYYTMSNEIAKHGTSHSLPQSYTYDDAVVTGSSWSIYDSSGNNVTSQFHTVLGTKDSTNAATNFSFTVDKNIVPDTYTVSHHVTDNWGSTSEDKIRTFTVSDIKQNYLTVHYIDKDSNTDIQDVDKQTSPYTPQAPSGYTLTGNYRTNPTGNDSIFNYNNGTEISVDLSTSDKEIYVMCKKSEEKGTVVKRYFLDGIEQKTDEQEIKDVPVGSQTYNVDKTYDGYTCSNPTVTVNVIANDKAYADFKFTSNPIPVKETGTVIKRYFLKGVEQTKDEEKIEDVSVGSHTYSAYKTYPRYTCEYPSVTVNVTANSTTYCDFNYGFENHPPTVTLQAPSEVVMGDDFDVNASGVDPDADPLTYTWNTPPDLKGSASGYTASGYFDNTGDKTYSVTVTDPYDASGSASKTIKVVPPIPNVVIDKSGEEKENRKVTLNADKYSSSGSNSGRYPLDWSRAKWQFFDGSGNELTVDSNPTSSTIVKSLQSTTGCKNMDLIFKKAGKYTAKCTLYNTAGYSNSFSVDLNIVLDLAPTADFNFPDGNNGYRDGKDLSPNGLAQGTDKLVDSSSSRDNDNIGKRMWLACFDSDNDGSFIDITNNEDGTKKAVPEKERWYVLDLDYNGDSDARYKIQVPDSTPLNGKLVTIGADGHKYAYINDSLNPHWRYVGSYDDVKKLDINKINCGNLTSVNFKSTSCGHFYYAEEIEESFGQETIPELITDKDKKQANTFEF